MTKGGGQKEPAQSAESTTAQSPVVPAPFGDGFDKNEVLKELRQLSKDIASLTTKVDRLVTDDEKTRGHVDALRHQITWAKGFAVSALILIPICAGFVWWLIGGELNQIRDRLYAMPTASVSAPPTPAASGAANNR